MASKGHSISRRYVRLGSGLDPRKLADTIAQIRDMPASTCVICEAPDNSDAWIHLEHTESGWSLLFGFPSSYDPAATLQQVCVEMPADSALRSWSEGIFANYLIPHSIGYSSLAVLIEQIMTRLHKVENPTIVEVALEVA